MRQGVAIGVMAAAAAAAAHPAAGEESTTPRVTFNFGPDVRASRLDKAELGMMNLRKSAGFGAYGLADALIQELLDKYAGIEGVGFHVQDSYTSLHNGILHVYLVETRHGVKVANGNVNANIDVATGKIVSMYDNTYAARELEAPSMMSGAMSAEANVDPRLALGSFLSLVTKKTPGFVDLFVSGCHDHEAMEAYEEETRVHESCRVNAGLNDAGVPTEKVWVHDGENLKLAWKFAVDSLDNWYEAYVEAQAALMPKTLMAVDWQRDFRPTGGEMRSEPVAPYTFMHVGTPHTPRTHAKSWGAWLGQGISSKIGDSKKSLVNAGKTVAAVVTGFQDMAGLNADAASKGPSVETRGVYRVFPWGVNDPSEGKRELLSGRAVGDKHASPYGWHATTTLRDEDIVYSDTRGNNVWAQENWEGANNYVNNYRPDGGKTLNFTYKLGWGETPSVDLDPRSYIDSSVTELFFTNNEIHDLFYRYGFDEVSGNFQDSNFGRGGEGDDAVQANAQDGSGYNNANFATPPDGYRPRMRMYVWTNSHPYRDGDLEAGIVIHEYAHGISTRLTGGPGNSGCLGFGEAGGMGEGWGDFFATMIRMHAPNETDFAMGEWASNMTNGIRNYRYSRNLTTNPDTYKALDQFAYWGVHAMGEVWAEMLFEVAENLIKKHGFADTLFPPALGDKDSDFYAKHPKTGKLVPTAGNALAVQLVVDGLKLQPCRPSFINARDAILDADKILTGGDNACAIWKGFAKRGLGPDAFVIGSTPWGGGTRTEDFDPKC